MKFKEVLNEGKNTDGLSPKFLKNLEKLTDINNHAEWKLEIANFIKDKALIKRAKDSIKVRDKEGGFSGKSYQDTIALYKDLMDKLKKDYSKEVYTKIYQTG